MLFNYNNNVISSNEKIINKINYTILLYGLFLVVIISGEINLQYAIPTLSCIYFLYFLSKKNDKIDSFDADLIINGLLILLIESVGVIKFASIQSFKNIISFATIVFLIYALYHSCIKVQKKILMLFYISMIAYILMLIYLKPEILVGANTLSGEIVFLSFNFIALFVINLAYKDRRHNELIFFIAIIPAVTIAIESAARTALLAVIIAIVCYYMFRFINFEKKHLQIIYFILILAVLLGVFFYANITEFSWYEKANEVSVKYFSKNIDSSRGYLWKSALENMNGMDFILGCGTGAGPTVKEYIGSSFHNSFIQMFYQNGVLGVVFLVLLLYKFWKVLIDINDDFIRCFFISVFIALIAYACMETCLIQNKTFLGYIQWSMITLGVCYRKIEKDNKNKENCYV